MRRSTFALLLTTLSLSGCGSDASSPAVPTPTPTPTTCSAPTWVTKAAIAPNVQFHTFASKSAGTTVSFHVYLPASYASSGTRTYPVLYWLHGTHGGAQNISAVASTLSAAMSSGIMPEMVVVFVNGLPEGMWVDAKSGRTPVESVLVHDLIPYVDSLFRTIASREGRGIEGFSMGGYGAARLAMKHPGLFRVAVMIAAGPLDLDFQGPVAQVEPALRARIFSCVYGDDLDYYRQSSPMRIAESNGSSVSGRVELMQLVGDRDVTYSNNVEFHLLLDRLGVRHQFIVFPGIDHNPEALLAASLNARSALYSRVFN
ncbi:MAG: alpha/beta hydrolase [Betaproteobacteria bacterium]